MISGLGTVFVISYGVVLIGRGTISVGALLAFYALVSQLYAPIVRLTQFQATAVATQVSVERLYEIFDEPEPVRDRLAARPLSNPRGALEFRDVHFAYSRLSRSVEERAEDARQAGGNGAGSESGPTSKVLHGVNLRIEPGMRVGVLGPSGAGKTTLMALAQRLYDLPEAADLEGRSGGSIRLDGVDVRDLKLADLRRAVALVPQQAMLLRGHDPLELALRQSPGDSCPGPPGHGDCRSYCDGKCPARRPGYPCQRARVFALGRLASWCASSRSGRCAYRPILYFSTRVLAIHNPARCRCW